MNQIARADSNESVRSAAARAGPTLSIRAILFALWRRRLLFAATVAAITAGAVFFALNATPIYVATSEVLVHAPEGDLTDVGAELVDGPAEEAMVENEVRVLLSRSLARRVIERVGLAEHPEFNPALAPEATDNTSQLTAAAVETGIERRYFRALEVEPFGKSQVLRISFASQSPELAAGVANVIAELYLVDQASSRSTAAEHANVWLRSRVDELREEVRAAEAEIAAFREQMNLVEAERASVPEEQISAMAGELVSAMAQQAQLEARHQQLQNLIAGNDPALLESLPSPVIQGLRAQWGTLEVRRAELSTIYGPGYPELQEVNQQLANIEAQLQAEVARSARSVEADLQAARRSTAQLDAEVRTLEARIGQANAAEGDLRVLEQEAEARRKLLEQFLARLNLTDQQQNLAVAEGRILSAAAVPQKPARPNKRLIAALGFLLAVLSGLLLVLAVETADAGVRGLQELREALDAPALGIVPKLARGWRRPRPHDVILERPHSHYGEAIRAIRTGLMLGRPGIGPTSILVTSSVQGEGKTSLSLSLARQTASSGLKTILVDCDLRHPSVGKLLASEGKTGVVDYLMGRASIEDVVQVDRKSALRFIVAGSMVKGELNQGVELFRSDRFAEFIGALSAQYDLVVIDSPPILPVTDAAVIATSVDAVLFVVRWKDAKTALVRSAFDQLQGHGRKFVGSVLNQVNVRELARYTFAESEFYRGKYLSYYVN